MRLVGYVRVSRVGGREGDSFISPSLQREQIEALARARRHQVVEWLEDLDESGGKWERPGFQRALQMVERGEADGIAVAKLDRFARSVVDALRAIERIRAAGGELISVADNFDTTTAIGKAMLQISLVFAELERDRQREGFHAAKTRAIERGIHMSTLVPIGYRRGRDRRLVPDRQEAAAVREVFLRRACGDSYGQLASMLDRRLPRDGGWPRTTVEKLIRNRVYLGEARQGAIVNAAAHEPLVTRAEWEAAQPRPTGRSAQRSGSLLAGLLACGSCGRPMSRATSRDYGCRSNRQRRGGCAAPAMIRIHVADETVTAAFLDWASRQEVEIRAADRAGAVEAAAAALEAAEQELAAYRDTQLVSVIGADAYRAGLVERAGRVDAAREHLHAAQADRAVPLAHLDAPSLWPDLSLPERKLLIASAVEHVEVLSSTLGLPPRDRVRVVFRDQREHELRMPRPQNL